MHASVWWASCSEVCNGGRRVHSQAQWINCFSILDTSDRNGKILLQDWGFKKNIFFCLLISSKIKVITFFFFFWTPVKHCSCLNQLTRDKVLQECPGLWVLEAWDSVSALISSILYLYSCPRSQGCGKGAKPWWLVSAWSLSREKEMLPMACQFLNCQGNWLSFLHWVISLSHTGSHKPQRWSFYTQ